MSIIGGPHVELGGRLTPGNGDWTCSSASVAQAGFRAGDRDPGVVESAPGG